jgi:hypothetical protein
VKTTVRGAVPFRGEPVKAASRLDVDDAVVVVAVAVAVEVAVVVGAASTTM